MLCWGTLGVGAPAQEFLYFSEYFSTRTACLKFLSTFWHPASRFIELLEDGEDGGVDGCGDPVELLLIGGGWGWASSMVDCGSL